MKKYIHYGNTKFDAGKVSKIRNRMMFTKPEGGFWASAADAEFSWKDWCDAEEFRDCKEENSFVITLCENARVLTVNSVQDLKPLPQLKNPLGFMLPTVYLDFEALTEKYDAIEVNISNDWGLRDALYGWDCDSLLVLNPDIIQEV